VLTKLRLQWLRHLNKQLIYWLMNFTFQNWSGQNRKKHHFGAVWTQQVVTKKQNNNNSRKSNAEKIKSKSNQIVAEEIKKGKGKLQDGDSDDVETGEGCLRWLLRWKMVVIPWCNTTFFFFLLFSDRVFGLHVSKR
jgi:hypothetical protein